MKPICLDRNKKDRRRAFSLGVMYTLPMLINFQAEVYHDGIVRLSLMREDMRLKVLLMKKNNL